MCKSIILFSNRGRNEPKKIRYQFCSILDFKTLVLDMMMESPEDILEDLTALSSKEYLTSIREAREDYKHGRESRGNLKNIHPNRESI